MEPDDIGWLVVDDPPGPYVYELDAPIVPMFLYHAIHLHNYLENNNSSRRISLCVVCALSDLYISFLLSCSWRKRGRLTSHPSTSFMISFSRAMAAWLRRYASRSCSARISGTRWILDQACSRFSSLSVSHCSEHSSRSVPSHPHPYPPKPRPPACSSICFPFSINSLSRIRRP